MNNLFNFVDIGHKRYTIREEPEVCPICHHASKPEQESWTLVGRQTRDFPDLEIVYKCPRAACNRLFIARYSGPVYAEGSLGYFALRELTPRVPKPPIVPSEVREISPAF